MKNLRLLGVQTHIGSQITEVKPFVQAIKKMLPLVQELKARHQIEFFDIGGGLGIVYDPALASGTPAWWKKQKVQSAHAGHLRRSKSCRCSSRSACASWSSRAGSWSATPACW